MKTIAIVFGGFSGEREISLRSAEVVADHLPVSEYTSYLVDINRDAWFVWLEGEKLPVSKENFSFQLDGETVTFDGVFSAIHGTPGEDGVLQGYFDLLGIPYNNCGVLSAALSFNKAACNSYLEAFGVNVAERVLVKLGADFNSEEIVKKVGLPCFIKPNDGGSSIGISKVFQEDEIADAIKLAQAEGVDALIERFLPGTEVSCGCISIDGQPKALAITEIVTANEFFDYDAKYDNDQTQEITPARLDAEVYKEIMELTEQIYTWLDCRGMIRIDFMVNTDGVFLIEPNTTPGLSQSSILPQQAVYCGYELSAFFHLSLQEMFKEDAFRKHALGGNQ